MAITTIPRLRLAMGAGMNEPGDFVARFLFPTSDVLDAELIGGTNTMKASVLKIDRGNFTGPRGRSLKRVQGQRAARRRAIMSEQTITIDERAEEMPFTDKEFESHRKRIRAVEDRLVGPALMQDFMIDEEVDVFAMYTGGSFTEGSTNTDVAKRFSSDSHNPIEEFDAGFDSVKTKHGRKINRLAISKNYFDALKRNAYLRGLLPYSDRGNITNSQLAEMLHDAFYKLSPTAMNNVGADFRIAVALGSHDSAADGLTSSDAYIWTYGAVMAAAPDVDARGRTAVEEVGAGKTFSAEGFRVTRYTDDETDEVRYKARCWDKAQIVDVNGFYHLTGYTSAG